MNKGLSGHLNKIKIQLMRSLIIMARNRWNTFILCINHHRNTLTSIKSRQLSSVPHPLMVNGKLTRYVNMCYRWCSIPNSIRRSWDLLAHMFRARRKPTNTGSVVFLANVVFTLWLELLQCCTIIIKEVSQTFSFGRAYIKTTPPS